MIVEKVMEGQLQDFFNVLIESIVDDIYTSTGKEVTKKDLKEGYSYKKVIANKKNTGAKATITKYVEPTEYTLKIKSTNGTTTLSYKLKKQDDSHFIVCYSEEYHSITNQKANKVIQYIHDRRIKKKTLNLLKAIQEHILSHGDLEDNNK